MIVDGVAEDEAVLFVPKGYPVQKHTFLIGLPYLLPSFAGIVGAVDARLSFFGQAGAYGYGRFSVQSFYAPEIQFFSAGYG